MVTQHTATERERERERERDVSSAPNQKRRPVLQKEHRHHTQVSLWHSRKETDVCFQNNKSLIHLDCATYSESKIIKHGNQPSWAQKRPVGDHENGKNSFSMNKSRRRCFTGSRKDSLLQKNLNDVTARKCFKNGQSFFNTVKIDFANRNEMDRATKIRILLKIITFEQMSSMIYHGVF